jgi:hypothetical protein
MVIALAHSIFSQLGGYLISLSNQTEKLFFSLKSVEIEF